MGEGHWAHPSVPDRPRRACGAHPGVLRHEYTLRRAGGKKQLYWSENSEVDDAQLSTKLRGLRDHDRRSSNARERCVPVCCSLTLRCSLNFAAQWRCQRTLLTKSSPRLVLVRHTSLPPLYLTMSLQLTSDPACPCIQTYRHRCETHVSTAIADADTVHAFCTARVATDSQGHGCR